VFGSSAIGWPMPSARSAGQRTPRSPVCWSSPISREWHAARARGSIDAASGLGSRSSEWTRVRC